MWYLLVCTWLHLRQSNCNIVGMCLIYYASMKNLRLNLASVKSISMQTYTSTIIYWDLTIPNKYLHIVCHWFYFFFSFLPSMYYVPPSFCLVSYCHYLRCHFSITIGCYCYYYNCFYICSEIEHIGRGLFKHIPSGRSSGFKVCNFVSALSRFSFSFQKSNADFSIIISNWKFIFRWLGTTLLLLKLILYLRSWYQ